MTATWNKLPYIVFQLTDNDYYPHYFDNGYDAHRVYDKLSAAGKKVFLQCEGRCIKHNHKG